MVDVSFQGYCCQKKKKKTRHSHDYIYNVVYLLFFVILYDNLLFVYDINLFMSEMASLSIACLSNRIQRLIHIQLQRYADLLYLLLILFPSKREVELISIK